MQDHVAKESKTAGKAHIFKVIYNISGYVFQFMFLRVISHDQTSDDYQEEMPSISYNYCLRFC